LYASDRINLRARGEISHARSTHILLSEQSTVIARAIRNVRSLRIAILIELKRGTQHTPPKPRHESLAF
jgi:hypothetical protein